MSEYAISLESARVNAKLTKAESAELLGVSVYTVTNWEKGKTHPTVIQARKICEIYNRPMDSIIF